MVTKKSKFICFRLPNACLHSAYYNNVLLLTYINGKYEPHINSVNIQTPLDKICFSTDSVE